LKENVAIRIIRNACCSSTMEKILERVRMAKTKVVRSKKSDLCLKINHPMIG